MTLLQLQYFHAVCKSGSITKAAKLMYVSQPTITISIKELESELNVNLLNRCKGVITLTKEGEIIFKRISIILNDIDLLTEEIKDLIGKRNHIKLGLPLQIGAFLLPKIIKKFQKQNPEIELELIEGSALVIKKMLLTEQMDVAIASVNADNPSLLWEPLFQTEVCFCVNKDHHLSKRKSISLKEVCNEQFVMFPDSFYTSNKVKVNLERNNVELFVKLYTNQLNTIKNLVINADLSTFLLKEAVQYDKDIIPISLDEPITATVGMLTKKGRHVYKDSRKLMQFIINEYTICNQQL